MTYINIIGTQRIKNTVYNQLVKKVNAIQTTDTSNLGKKLTMIQKLAKLKRKLLIMIIISMLPHKNSIN